MSHNATGYSDDMNPDMIDGIAEPSQSGRPSAAPTRPCGPKRSSTACDPSRIVYHHSSGNLGSMHTSNFYPNWAPIQEMCDWFEHWATVGVKPVFTCEYRVPCHAGTGPCTAAGTRASGNSAAPRALGVLPRRMERPVPRRPGLPDQRSGKGEPPLGGQAVPGRRGLAALGLSRTTWDPRAFDDAYPVFAHVSDRQLAGLPHLGDVGQLALGARPLLEAARAASTRAARSSRSTGRTCSGRASARLTSATRYERMRPGLRAIGLDCPRLAAEATDRNNMPLLAYIGGKPAAFTSKDHNFLPGETVEKQLIVINNSPPRRFPASAAGRWAFPPGHRPAASRSACPRASRNAFRSVSTLPAELAPGKYELDCHRQVQQRRDAEGHLRHPRAPAAAGRKTGGEDRPVRSQGRDGQAAGRPGREVPAASRPTPISPATTS